MNFLTKYFNRKKHEQHLIIESIKKNFDFDHVNIIRKNDTIFKETLMSFLTILANNYDPKVKKDFINTVISNIEGLGDYCILKLSRTSMTCCKTDYAFLLKHNNTYFIPSRYITHNFFKESINPYIITNEYIHHNILNKMRTLSYNGDLSRGIKYIDNNFIPYWAMELYMSQNGLIITHPATEIVKNRQLEIYFERILNTNTLSVKLLYGSLLLKEDFLKDVTGLNNFMDNFLFPYNLTEEELKTISLEAPLKFDLVFLQSINKDLKLTLDMMKI